MRIAGDDTARRGFRVALRSRVDVPEPVAPPSQARPVAATVVAAFAFAYATFALVLLPQVQPAALRDLGLDVSAAARIHGVTFAAAALGGLALGRAADRGRRRVALAACVALPAVGTLAASFAEGAASLLLARVLTGFGVGGGFGVAHTAVAAALPPARRATAAGVVQAGSPLGIVGAVLLASRSSVATDWREVHRLGALPGLALLFWPWLISSVPESASDARVRLRDAFSEASRSATLRILLLLALHMAAFWLSVAWIPQWLADGGRAPEFVRRVQLALCAGFLTGNLAFGPLARKAGMRAAFFAGSIYFAAGLAFLPTLVRTLDARPLALAVASWAVGLGAGVWTAFGPFFAALVAPEVRGIAASASYQFARGTQFFLQPAVPLLLALGGFQAVFFAAAAFAVLGGCGVRLLPAVARNAAAR
jgi:predicted MFS family arabinose efflux permease